MDPRSRTTVVIRCPRSLVGNSRWWRPRVKLVREYLYGLMGKADRFHDDYHVSDGLFRLRRYFVRSHTRSDEDQLFRHGMGCLHRGHHRMDASLTSIRRGERGIGCRRNRLKRIRKRKRKKEGKDICRHGPSHSVSRGGGVGRVVILTRGVRGSVVSPLAPRQR